MEALNTTGIDDFGTITVEATVDGAARLYLSVSLLAMLFSLQRHILYQGANIYAGIARTLGKIIGAIITI
jgi:hypothetical protein